MSKRPSFQFYPGDWTQNSNLRRCSHELKGVWIDVLCVLHDQDEYGVAFWSLKDIAEASGTTVAKLKMLVERGILKGAEKGQVCPAFEFIPTGAGRKKKPPVLLIAEQKGPIWFSSRMVVDEYKRLVRADNGEENKEAPMVALKYPIGAAPKVTPDPAPSHAGASSSSSSSPSGKPLSEQTAAAANTAEGGSATASPPPASCPPDENQKPSAEAIADLLTVLEAARGKRWKTGSHGATLQRWSDAGVTMANIRDAHGLAVMARNRDGDQAPVNAGFLGLFVEEVQRDSAAGGVVVTDERAAVYTRLRAEYGGKTVVGPDGRQFEISLSGSTAIVIQDGKAIGAISGVVMLKFLDDIEAGVLKELNDGGLV